MKIDLPERCRGCYISKVCLIYKSDLDGYCPCTSCLLKIVCRESCSVYLEFGKKLTIGKKQNLEISHKKGNSELVDLRKF